MHSRIAGLLALVLFLPAARPPDDVTERLRRLTPIEMDEVLWLARCIYSESDRPEEQRLVAWVVRNRKETAYRGDTYREVVLEDRQFSAFNEPSARRAYILGLNQNSDAPGWRKALGIALDVFQANPKDRPFPVTVRHFYSPVSMKGRTAPPWARFAAPLDPAPPGIDPNRFLFFDGVDEALDPEGETVTERIERRHVSRRAKVGSLRERMRSRLSGRVRRPVRPHVGGKGRN
ncbi:cell wall hydrolase [Rhodocaloribacter sp.]